VVGPQGINLGQGPGFNFGHVQIVGRGDIVFVLEGPERGDDLWWWKVVTRDGVQGWGINDHLAPYSGACFAEATQVSAAPTVLSGQVAGTSGSTTQTSGELPATGTNAGGVIAAGVLAIVLVVVGLLRRRNQDSD
jgi:LPXTG-motif cell wall-anchored protein